MVVDHQVVDRALHKVAKAALARVRVLEVATEKPQGEFLGQVLGGIGVPQRGQQVTLDGPAVAAHQPLERF